MTDAAEARARETGAAEVTVAESVEDFCRLVAQNEVRIVLNLKRTVGEDAPDGPVTYWDSSSFNDDVAKALVEALRSRPSHAESFKAGLEAAAKIVDAAQAAAATLAARKDRPDHTLVGARAVEYACRTSAAAIRALPVPEEQGVELETNAVVRQRWEKQARAGYILPTADVLRLLNDVNLLASHKDGERGT
jgi:hypothetical protein